MHLVKGYSLKLLIEFSLSLLHSSVDVSAVKCVTCLSLQMCEWLRAHTARQEAQLQQWRVRLRCAIAQKAAAPAAAGKRSVREWMLFKLHFYHFSGEKEKITFTRTVRLITHERDARESIRINSTGKQWPSQSIHRVIGVKCKSYNWLALLATFVWESFLQLYTTMVQSEWETQRERRPLWTVYTSGGWRGEEMTN